MDETRLARMLLLIEYLGLDHELTLNGILYNLGDNVLYHSGITGPRLESGEQGLRKYDRMTDQVSFVKWHQIAGAVVIDTHANLTSKWGYPSGKSVITLASRRRYYPDDLDGIEELIRLGFVEPFGEASYEITHTGSKFRKNVISRIGSLELGNLDLYDGEGGV